MRGLDPRIYQTRGSRPRMTENKGESAFT